MERITDVKQFIDGKGYYCKNKINGQLTINYIYNDNGIFWLNNVEDARNIFKIHDIIGPVPEIKDEIILSLFDYPDLVEVFSRPLWIREDGSVIIYNKNFLDEAEKFGYTINDRKDILDNFFDDDPEKSDNPSEERPFQLDGDGNVVLSDFQFKDDIRYKVGNYIKLKTDLHNEVGCFPTGSVLKIIDKFNHGYIVGNDYMEVFASKDCFDIIIIHS